MAEIKEVKVTALKIPAFKFPVELQEQWVDNAKRFISPIALMYVGQLLVEFTKVSQGDQVINGAMFVPTQIMIGGMVLYILNILLDLFTKWKNPTTIIK